MSVDILMSLVNKNGNLNIMYASKNITAVYMKSARQKNNLWTTITEILGLPEQLRVMKPSPKIVPNPSWSME